MKHAFFSLMALTFAFAVSAAAAPAAKSTSTISKGNTKFPENTGITDMQLKIESGSMSEFSLKIDAGLSGPPIDDLSNRNRPNPDGAIGGGETVFSTNIAGRYRLSSDFAMEAGAGFALISPMHGAGRTEGTNPYVGADHTDRFGDIQMRNAATVHGITSRDFRDTGAQAILGLENSSMMNLSGSGRINRVSVGLDTAFTHTVYTRSYEDKDGASARAIITLSPVGKYSLTNELNAYASPTFTFWNPRSNSNTLALHNQEATARVGLGWMPARSLYMTPYLDFYPGKMGVNNTTINFKATLLAL